MSRVVVVGAGVGGLAAAARLAAAGHRVTVLEQADAVGGKLGTWSHDGHRFDTGPSLLTMPHLLEELLAATGAPLADVLPLERLAVACRYRFPDGTVLDLPGDAADVPDALDSALGPGRGAQWAALMDRAARVWDVTHGPFLERPVRLRDLALLSRRLDHVATVAPWRSLRGLGATYLRDPRLRMLLDRYATYSGSDPRRAPAALLAVPHAEQRWGSWYVPGGLRRIAEVLLDRVVSLGVDVRCSTRVERVLRAGGPRGRVTGVRLRGGADVVADVVVANADAERLYRDLLPSGPAVAWQRARLRRATPSSSGLALLLSVERPPGRPEPSPHHAVLFAEDYDAEFDALFGRGGPPRPVDRPTVYVNVPRDAAVAPADAESWFVLVNAPRHDPSGTRGGTGGGTGGGTSGGTSGGTDWTRPGLADDHADRVLAVLAERGLEVRDRVRHREVRSPADLERLTLSPGGSIYGTSSNGAAAAFLRPANRSPVAGLYLVGGSAHPGGGLPLVLLSARITAGLVGPA